MKYRKSLMISFVLAFMMIFTFWNPVFADETDVTESGDGACGEEISEENTGSDNDSVTEENGICETTIEESAVSFPMYADNDELAEQFIMQEMSADTKAYPGVFNYTSGLSETNASAYTYVKQQVLKIASGEITSTKIILPDEFEYTFTSTDLGIDVISSENIDLITQKVKDALPISCEAVNTALLNSCPYDLYWFDKVSGVTLSYSARYDYYNQTVTVSSFKFSFTVAEEYRYDSDPYTVSSEYGQAASAASDNVKSIIEKYSALDDYDKLLAYNNEICGLVEYNHDAVDYGVAYGNPWQLVWVFDGDDSTDVVCEGYAKAFQYLCDNSTFKDKTLYVLSISGTAYYSPMSYGGHMWNIVHMYGENYLVDVTNNDNEPGNEYFLIGAVGNVDDGYELYEGSKFYYDDTTKDFFSETVLTLSESDFDPSEPIIIPITGWSTCEDGSICYYDDNGYLVSGWYDIDGNTYYFASDGALQTQWQSIDGNRYYFDPTGGAMTTGWKKIDSNWYYFGSGGEMTTGWKKINGYWYFFFSGGEMTTGWKKINGYWYFFVSGGEMTTGWKKINGYWYYFGSGGEMTTGWKKINGYWYYFGSGGEMTTGWKKISGKWYYLGSNGVMQTNWKKIDGNWYYFGTNGIMVTGSKKIGSKVYKFNTSGICLNR